MTTPRPDWAPDNCPPNVVQLIEHEDVLEKLKLRGLTSADSKAVHSATERLKHLLMQRYYDGWNGGRKAGLQRGVLVGVASALIGAAIGAGILVLI